MTEIPLELRHNVADSRYEAETAGEVAVSQYELDGNTVIFTHTLVPGAIEGLGIGTRLVLYSLDDARARGWLVVPHCPFVLAVIQGHPGYADLVAPRAQGLLSRSTGGHA